MRRVVGLLIVTAVAVAVAASAFASTSPKAVRASIGAAALAQKSVRLTYTYGADLYGTDHRTIDVSADSGVERVTYPMGSKAEFRLVNDTIYVKATAGALEDYVLYLTKPQAKHYADRWISIPKGNKFYDDDHLRLASIVRDAIPRGKLKLVRTTSHGMRLVVVEATSPNWPNFSSLAAHASAERLPVSFSYGGESHDVSAHFSKWNEPLSVQAPAHSTPIATVRGG